jgi:small subunit ribosomal protein S9
MAEKKSAKVALTYYLGTGRRKTAVARVRITEGKGQILINDRTVEEYFSEEKDRAAVYGPLKVTDQLNRVDVFIRCTGGGVTGQAGAASQGVARALKTMFSPPSEQKRYTFNNTTVVRSYQDEKKTREKAKAIPAKPSPADATSGTSLIPTAPAAEEPTDLATGMIKKLRDSGYLTRDARMKERKKYGLRGARRGTQFSKR